MQQAGTVQTCVTQFNGLDFFDSAAVDIFVVAGGQLVADTSQTTGSTTPCIAFSAASATLFEVRISPTTIFGPTTIAGTIGFTPAPPTGVTGTLGQAMEGDGIHGQGKVNGAAATFDAQGQANGDPDGNDVFTIQIYDATTGMQVCSGGGQVVTGELELKVKKIHDDD